jgi:hypothetical protein
MADSWYSFGCVSSVLRCLLRCLAAPLTLTVNPYFLNDFVVVFGFCVKPMVLWLRSSVPLRVFFLFFVEKIYCNNWNWHPERAPDGRMYLFFLHQAIGTHVAGKGLAWNHKARQTCWKSVSLGWAMNKSKQQRYKIHMRTRVVRQCFSFQTCSLFHAVASK